MSGCSENQFYRGQEFIRPEFGGLDSNDFWVGECEAQGCHGQHILKNNKICLPSHQIMNWWDFLDVLECYEKQADCNLCTRCHWCKFFLKKFTGGGMGADMEQLEDPEWTVFYGGEVQPP